MNQWDAEDMMETGGSEDLVEVELKTPGQVAYEQSSSWYVARGYREICPWAELTTETRDYWERIAQAVLETCR